MTTTAPEIVEAHLTGEIPSAATPMRMAPAAPTTLFGTTDPNEVVAAATAHATALTAILEERHLYAVMGTDSKGNERRHVQIEGWALLGSMTGVFAHTVWTRELVDDKGKPLGWEARAEAQTLAGATVGAAEAECRWAESKWSGRDSYALRSMAQTRAQSKALAMPLRFIVELAGFSGTPAEEISDGGMSHPDNDYKCPACEAGVWDNSQDPNRGKRPVFKCRNNGCTGGSDGRPWASWDPDFFADIVVAAKMEVMALVVANPDAWAAQYPRDDPSYEASEAELVAAAHDGTDAERAGYLWHRIRIHSDMIGWPQGAEERPTKAQLAVVVRAAEIILEDDEPTSEVMALEQASDLIEMERDEDRHMDGYGA